MNLIGLLFGIGRVLWKGIQYAHAMGLTDALMDVALSLVTEADVQFATNEERLAYAVAELMERCNVKESVANFAVDAAVLAMKAKKLRRAS